MFVSVCIHSERTRFFAAIVQLLAGLGRFVLGQAGGQQLLAELLQILQGEPIRPKAFLEFFLGVVQRVRTVHVTDQEMFLFLEPIIAETDRILDDIISAPLIFLRGNIEIGANAQAYMLAAFQIAGGSFGLHMGMLNDLS